MTGFLHNLLRSNIIVIYFIYGLAFFTMGLSVFLRHKSFSAFLLAREMWLLAMFGVLHGLAIWGYVFIPLQALQLSEGVVVSMQTVHMILLASSYAFLVAFGSRMVIQRESQSHVGWTWLVPTILVAMWIVSSGVFGRSSDPHAGVVWGLVTSNIWARYILGIPGAILTSYALMAQAEIFGKLGLVEAKQNLTWASAGFLIYAVTDGLIVPEGSFFPASFLNYNAFFKATGLPVEFFRTLVGVGLFYVIIKVLEIFDLERTKRMEEAERREGILGERVRIARELHDGIIQSIYAQGLTLKGVLYQLGDAPASAKAQIEDVIKKIDNTIRDIRAYIMNLKTHDVEESLCGALESIVRDFKQNTWIDAVLECSETGLTLADWQQFHVKQILREALNNVAKHSRASKVKVKVVPNGHKLILTVKDNGVGFDVPKVQSYYTQGLQNMLERAKLLRGRLEVVSSRGSGTEVILEIPMGRDFVAVEDSVGG